MSTSGEKYDGAALLGGVPDVAAGEPQASSTATVVERVVIRSGAFQDPAVLMQIAEEARALPGVEHVALGMVDPLNLLILAERFGYAVQADGLGANDLVIAMRCTGEDAADDALAAIDRELTARSAEREVRDIGPYTFTGDRDDHTLQRATWRVAEPGAHQALLDRLAPRAEQIARANDEAVARMQAAHPIVAGVATARDVLPGMTPTTILHAGPPIDWADMSGPLRGAIIGAALLEGLADDPDDAARRAAAGHYDFAPGHEHGALGPMVGVISASMPVWVVENATHGNRAQCNFSEGYGRVLRFGAYAPAVIDKLRWISAVAAPLVGAALERLDAPLDIRAISADAVQMGDEVHNRNRAATAQVFRAIAPALIELDAPTRDIVDVARYIATNDYFYLNLSMAAGKATAEAAARIPDATIVTTMARNGTEFGLRMSGTGDRWFTAPAGRIEALFRPGHFPEDANDDVGDSTITETIGLGGFAMAASPAIGRFAGISAEDAVRATLAMYDITWAESVNYRIPALGYRGTPLGIDCRKVVQTGVTPVCNTGVAHREAGVGVIGGGIVRVPAGPFAAALEAVAAS